MKTMNSDPVQDYILESEDNLRIAVEVGNAWAKAEERLGLDFLNRLKGALELKKELKGWKFEELWGRPFVNGEAGLDFGKLAWKKDYYVSLWLLDYGEDVTFGLSRDKERIKTRQHCDELLTAVREHYSTARPHGWWEAYVTMDPQNWRKPDVLWNMHKDPDFLNQVAQDLLEVARISERFVDQLAGEK
jgi:hypothetical protein